MSPLLRGDSKDAAYAWAPIVSTGVAASSDHLDTPAEIAVWLNGKPVAFTGESPEKASHEPRSSTCPRGRARSDPADARRRPDARVCS